MPHQPQVLELWGITDEACFIGFCYDCRWLGPVRPEFDEADADVEAHLAAVDGII